MNILEKLNLTLDVLCQIIGVDNPYGNIPINSIVHLRRKCQPGCVCFAFKNWNIDSISSVEYAIAHGASIIVCDKKIPGVKCIVVENPLRAYLKVANWCLKEMHTTTVAVAGSIGKTSTTDMIYSTLSEKRSTYKSKGNTNSCELAAMNVFEMDDEYEYFVQESTIHDVEDLSWCVQPKYAVITNIGLSHSETFGEKSSILERKMKLTKHLTQDGIVVLNADDPYLYEFSKKTNKKVVTYAINNMADCRATNIVFDNEKSEFDICYKNEITHCVVSSIGEHNILNALAAFIIAEDVGMERKDIVDGIKKWRPEGNRQNMIIVNGINVYVDCFNASSESVIGALKTIDKLSVSGKKIAVLADILELGVYSVSEHEKVGKYINENADIDVLILYGPLARHIGQIIKRDDLDIFYTCDRDELKALINKSTKSGDVILFKGSHGMALDEIVDRLYGTNYSNINGYENTFWLRLNKMGINISDYLKKQGIKSVALINYSGIARNLADVLYDEGMVVDYIIDNRYKYAKDGTYKFKMISLEGPFPPVDLMVDCVPNNEKDTNYSVALHYEGKIINYMDFERSARSQIKIKNPIEE